MARAQRLPTARFRAIKHAIDAVDPMELLAFGAPDDEYDNSVWLILDRLNDGRDDLRTIVRDVFSWGFGFDLKDDQLATLSEAIQDALNKVTQSQ